MNPRLLDDNLAENVPNQADQLSEPEIKYRTVTGILGSTIIAGSIGVLQKMLGTSYCRVQGQEDSYYQGMWDKYYNLGFQPPMTPDYSFAALLNSWGSAGKTASIAPLSYGLYKLGKAESKADYGNSAIWITSGLALYAGGVVSDMFASKESGNYESNYAYRAGYNEEIVFPDRSGSDTGAGGRSLLTGEQVTSASITLLTTAFAFFAGHKAKTLARQQRENQLDLQDDIERARIR